MFSRLKNRKRSDLDQDAGGLEAIPYDDIAVPETDYEKLDGHMGSNEVENLRAQLAAAQEANRRFAAFVPSSTKDSSAFLAAIRSLNQEILQIAMRAGTSAANDLSGRVSAALCSALWTTCLLPFSFGTDSRTDRAMTKVYRTMASGDAALVWKAMTASALAKLSKQQEAIDRAVGFVASALAQVIGEPAAAALKSPVQRAVEQAARLSLELAGEARPFQVIHVGQGALFDAAYMEPPDEADPSTVQGTEAFGFSDGQRVLLKARLA